MDEKRLKNCMSCWREQKRERHRGGGSAALGNF